eukprot:gnl/Dysnectes_brevis/6852_a10946_237.p1 GENE.gnl/Dysnectes_brevis/6852_a10946_237~~gnl/Dysnectes_brevis/6852_a10946_237.p1  ORF type:complete len:279 (-),score=62.18 gnl/Dysnectes_brevis/6852_a10946_237:53-889(-)
MHLLNAFQSRPFLYASNNPNSISSPLGTSVKVMITPTTYQIRLVHKWKSIIRHGVFPLNFLFPDTSDLHNPTGGIITSMYAKVGERVSELSIVQNTPNMRRHTIPKLKSTSDNHTIVQPNPQTGTPTTFANFPLGDIAPGEVVTVHVTYLSSTRVRDGTTAASLPLYLFPISHKEAAEPGPSPMRLHRLMVAVQSLPALQSLYVEPQRLALATRRLDQHRTQCLLDSPITLPGGAPIQVRLSFNPQPPSVAVEGPQLTQTGAVALSFSPAMPSPDGSC